MQLKLLFNEYTIPEEYDYANLYENMLIKDKNICFGSGYNGPKTLVFYNDKTTGKMWSQIEGADMKFINFEEAYNFIITNKIRVYNISYGSWEKEIKEYERKNKWLIK